MNDKLRVRYLEFRAWLDKAKDRPCADCDGEFPPCCMDFDHVRGPKLFGIGNGMRRKRATVVAEMAKCDLICSNCHRIRTQLRFEDRKELPYSAELKTIQTRLEV